MDNLIQMSNHLKNDDHFDGIPFKRPQNKSLKPLYPGLAPLRGQGPVILPFLCDIYIIFMFFQFLYLPGQFGPGKKARSCTRKKLRGEPTAFSPEKSLFSFTADTRVHLMGTRRFGCVCDTL